MGFKYQLGKCCGCGPGPTACVFDEPPGLSKSTDPTACVIVLLGKELDAYEEVEFHVWYQFSPNEYNVSSIQNPFFLRVSPSIKEYVVFDYCAITHPLKIRNCRYSVTQYDGGPSEREHQYKGIYDVTKAPFTKIANNNKIYVNFTYRGAHDSIASAKQDKRVFRRGIFPASGLWGHTFFEARYNIGDFSTFFQNANNDLSIADNYSVTSLPPFDEEYIKLGQNISVKIAEKKITDRANVQFKLEDEHFSYELVDSSHSMTYVTKLWNTNKFPVNMKYDATCSNIKIERSFKYTMKCPLKTLKVFGFKDAAKEILEGKDYISGCFLAPIIQNQNTPQWNPNYPHQNPLLKVSDFMSIYPYLIRYIKPITFTLRLTYSNLKGEVFINAGLYRLIIKRMSQRKHTTGLYVPIIYYSPRTKTIRASNISMYGTVTSDITDYNIEGADSVTCTYYAEGKELSTDRIKQYNINTICDLAKGEVEYDIEFKHNSYHNPTLTIDKYFFHLQTSIDVIKGDIEWDLPSEVQKKIYRDNKSFFDSLRVRLYGNAEKDFRMFSDKDDTLNIEMTVDTEIIETQTKSNEQPQNNNQQNNDQQNNESNDSATIPETIEIGNRTYRINREYEGEEYLYYSLQDIDFSHLLYHRTVSLYATFLLLTNEQYDSVEEFITPNDIIKDRINVYLAEHFNSLEIEREEHNPQDLFIEHSANLTLKGFERSNGNETYYIPAESTDTPHSPPTN